MAAPHHTPTQHDLELLSAYLDGELSDRELEKLERRLALETDLQVALEELRGTVALLGALPRLKAPRNFTLDPAVHGRPVTWWKQLLASESILQLSGAAGVIASVLVIFFALAAGVGDKERSTGTQAGLAGESVAIHPTAQPEIAAAITEGDTQVAETAIAYAGEGLIQTTIIAQSTLYAVPPVPEGTPWPMVAEGETAPQVEMQESGAVTADSSLGDTVAPEAEYPAQEPMPYTPPEADFAPPQAYEAAPGASAADDAAQAEPWLGSDETGGAAAGVAEEDAAPAIEPTATGALTAENASESAAQAAARDHEAQKTDTSDQQPSTASPEPMSSATQASLAQAFSEDDATGSPSRHGDEDRDGSTDTTTPLLLAGAIMFVFSVGLIVLGRKKSAI